MVIILAVLGGGALLLMLSGVLGGGISGSSQEFAAGDCVSPVETVTSFGFAAGANECDSDFPAEVLGTFEPVGIDQMPNENDPFWRTAFERCADMMSADGIPLPMPSATTEQEWADGNHTIVCVWISAESLGEAFAEGFAALDN